MTPDPNAGKLEPLLLVNEDQAIAARNAAVVPEVAPRRRRRRGSGVGGRLTLLLLVFGAAFGIYTLIGTPIRLPIWAVAEVEQRLNVALGPSLQKGGIAVGGIEVMVGDDWVPHLVLEQVRLLQAEGKALLTLPETQMSFDGDSLLHGKFRAKSLRIIGARLAVRRDQDGHFDLAFGDGQGPQIKSLAALFDAADQMFAQPALTQLTNIEVEALSLTLTDLREGKTWEVGDGRLSFENRSDELAAELGMSLVTGASAPARAVLTVVAAKGAGRARVTAQVDQLAAKDLASQTALLGFLGVLDAPISGQIAATIDKDGIQEMSGRLDLGAGALKPAENTTAIPFDQASIGLGYEPADGRILLTDLSVQSASLRAKATGRAYMVDADGRPVTGALSDRRPAAFLGQIAISELKVDPEGLFEKPVEFSQGAIDLRLRLDPFAVDLGQASLVAGDQTLRVSGHVAADTGGWRSAVDVAINKVTLDRLLALWPPRVVPNTRLWIKDNIRNAELTNVRAALRIEPGSEPKMELGYSFQNTDVRFMNQMPLVTGADGYSTIIGTTFTQVMTKGHVTPPEGGAVDVSGTVFAVPDILAHPAYGDVSLKAMAPLSAMLSLLDQPPFHYMEKAGQPVDLGTGTAAVVAHITLPLVNQIGFGDVIYAVKGTVRDFASDKVVKGRTITAPVLTVTADEKGMTIAGPGLIGKVPFNVTFAQDFGLAPGPARIDGTVTLSQKAVEEFGLGLPKSMVSGEGSGTVAISLPRGASPTMTLTSDLKGIILAIPELGWRKAAGAAGRLDSEVTLGPVPDVTTLKVSGAGLTATGRVKLKGDGGLDVAQFSNVTLGGWLNGAVEIRGRGSRPVGLAVTSGSIDIRKFPSSRGSSGSADGSPIAVNLAALRITDGIKLTGFQGDFTLKGGFNGNFSGKINGQTAVTGSVGPSAHGTAVRVQSGDAGGAMKSAGMFSSAFGGSLDMTLVPQATEGNYDGTAKIGNLRVKSGSVMADLLSAISIIGLLDQLNGDGIVFNTAQAEFLMTPNAIDVYKGSAVGVSMGVSMQGLYHSDTSKLDMTGVVSPIYLLNGIGSILTRKGEGLFGFAYRLKGTADDPDVQVNPLSILTPGMFRDLFRAPPPTLGPDAGDSQ
ncbi:MAG: AsmA-like C-terminal region-containing protein [bacterium]